LGLGGTFEEELRLLTPEGDERWIHARGRLDVKDGKPVRLLCATIDITAIKTNEQALLASEARFRGIFENAAVGAAVIGLDGDYLLVNQRMCDIVGYSRDEMLTKTIKDLTDPADFADNLARGRSALAGEITTFSTDKRYVRKNGDIIWCGLTVSLQFDPSGAPEYFIAIVRDITPRRRAQEELRDRVREIEALYDNAPVGLTVLDRNRRLVRMNRTLAAMHGLSADESTGRFAWDVVPALREIIDPKLDEVLATGRAVELERSGETP